VARYNGDNFERALEFLAQIEKLTRTNGFTDEVIRFLSTPSKFNIVERSCVIITPTQRTELDSQIAWYRNLVSLPNDQQQGLQDSFPHRPNENENLPQTPERPQAHRRAWPTSPFPTLDSSPQFVYHPPPPSSTTSQIPPRTPTRIPASQIFSPNRSPGYLSPQARAQRFSNPPLSPLVSATSTRPPKPLTRSPLFRTPGLIHRIRQRPPYSASRPKLPLRISPELLNKFIQLSAPNSNIGVETGAILGGFISPNKSFYTVDHLFVPDQVGYPTYYSDTNGDACALLMIQRNRLNLGTIHTHPGHLESFMSSVDLHMHSLIQKDNNSAIAFVHSPRYGTTPSYSLTDFGLGVILSCKASNATGHLHEETNLYVEANNVHWDPCVTFICEDLRSNIFQSQPSTPPSTQSGQGTSSQADAFGSNQAEDFNQDVSDPATPYTPPQTRANSFRSSNFQGIQFPKAARGRGRPPLKKRRTEAPRRDNLIGDDSDSDDGFNVAGISDPVFTGKRKPAKKKGGKRGRPFGSVTVNRGIRSRGRGRGPGRPPLSGEDIIKRGRTTSGKSQKSSNCHLCLLRIETDDDETTTCGCGEVVHEDCCRMDGCD